MTKYHLTEDGPKICTANKKPCKYGETQHYETIEAASKAFEEKQKENVFKKLTKSTLSSDSLIKIYEQDFFKIGNDFRELSFKNIKDEKGIYIDGKDAVLYMKNNNSHNWRQMEWAGFLSEDIIKNHFKNNPNYLFPENDTDNKLSFNKVGFDFGYIHKDVVYLSDIKTHSIINQKDKPAFQTALNDKEAIDKIVLNNQFLTLIRLNVKPIYDVNNDFKIFHDRLKGKESAYVKKNSNRSSRARKSGCIYKSIDIFVLDNSNQSLLKIFKQGKNSNGKPRNSKYILDDTLIFPKSTILF